MEIEGKIILAQPEVSGAGKNGTAWRKQNYVLETQEQYPKKICFVVWGEKIDQFALSVGEMVQVSIDIESREYNEKWYTDVKAYKVNKIGSASSASASSPSSAPIKTEPVSTFSGSDDNDLPF